MFDVSPVNSAVGIFDSHTQAAAAVLEFKRENADIRQLSVVGRDYHSDEHIVGYYNTGDRMKYWGKQGAFWGGVWGVVPGAGFFLVPGVGPLLVAGPLVASIIAAAEGAALLGNASIVGAAFVGLGIPEHCVMRYETAINMGKYILIFHGGPEEVANAKRLFTIAKAKMAVIHTAEPAVSVLG